LLAPDDLEFQPLELRSLRIFCIALDKQLDFLFFTRNATALNMSTTYGDIYCRRRPLICGAASSAALALQNREFV
jgi:hypothetical protein